MRVMCLFVSPCVRHSIRRSLSEATNVECERDLRLGTLCIHAEPNKQANICGWEAGVWRDELMGHLNSALREVIMCLHLKKRVKFNHFHELKITNLKHF